MTSIQNIIKVVCLMMVGTSLMTTSLMGQKFEIDQSRSSIKYSASHPLHDWEAPSNKITGFILLDKQAHQNISVELEVPVESFDSQNSNRDSNMLDVVDVDRFPTAKFTLDKVTPTEYDGSDYNASWIVSGNLTFHGVTNPIEFTVSVQQSGSDLQATGDFMISLEAFGIKRPSLMLMKMKDSLNFVFDLWATESN